MIKLKNLLAESMRRFKTKNLNEDSDQNNNGYPDNTENSSFANDPILKQYGFTGTSKPDKLKGKLVSSSHLKGVTTIAYFDNSNWNLPENPYDRNEIKHKIHTTLANALSKYVGGKLKSIWASHNADLPDNITALAMIGEKAPIIKIINGSVHKNLTHTSFVDDRSVSKMSRKVFGTYNGKPFELETIDGMTVIQVNGEVINDEDIKYQEILDAVIAGGYELYTRMLHKKDYEINPN